MTCQTRSEFSYEAIEKRLNDFTGTNKIIYLLTDTTEPPPRTFNVLPNGDYQAVITEAGEPYALMIKATMSRKLFYLFSRAARRCFIIPGPVRRLPANTATILANYFGG